MPSEIEKKRARSMESLEAFFMKWSPKNDNILLDEFTEDFRAVLLDHGEVLAESGREGINDAYESAIRIFCGETGS